MPVTVPYQPELDDSSKDTLSRRVADVTPPAQELNDGELMQLIHEWRDEISAEQVQTDYTASLALRSRGRELSEGAVLYKAGYLNKNTYSFNRVVGIFSNVINDTSDPIVTIVAHAYLQLAFYRSHRFRKAASMHIPLLPKAFSRLEVEMRGLRWMLHGDEPRPLEWKDGLGFSDLSLLGEDRFLEEEIRVRIEDSPPARQAGSQPSFRTVRYRPKCRLCGGQFELYIDLIAHLNPGARPSERRCLCVHCPESRNIGYMSDRES